MAGYFAVADTFDWAAYSAIYDAGFDLTVRLDLSHCGGTTTTGQDGSVMQKGIELDVEIRTGRLDATSYAALVANLAAQPAVVRTLVNQIQAWGGWTKLSSQHAKVEFPTIGTDVFDPTSPDGTVALATEAATAADATAFNALEDYTRQELGMFRWDGSWVREGSPESTPRTAP